ncbi:hypothetical protein LTR66_003878 [Elasticomyces elasticus]|nr:hypothetical protein LTR66_003878 [Elasticomyces elasticus]
MYTIGHLYRSPNGITTSLLPMTTLLPRRVHTGNPQACPRGTYRGCASPSQTIPHTCQRLTVENVFIQALVHASLCSSHGKPVSPYSRRTVSTSARRKCPQMSRTSIQEIPRGSHQQDGRKGTAHAAAMQVTKEEANSLLSFYDSEADIPDSTTEPEASKSPPISFIHTNDAPPQPIREPWRPDDDYVASALSHLDTLLADHLTPHDRLYEVYLSLPRPHVPYLSDVAIRALLHHLSVVEHHSSEVAMLRYLSVVDDMTTASIPMTAGEWNSAIAFAGRWVRHIGPEQIETATKVWIRMESEAGIKGTNVTFNILFDVATKAGKYALAEVIMREMRDRGMELNRYFRVGLIYYYGLRGNGEALRAAFRELVEAGEIVDTSVVNCLISALIRAGEPTAAEHVFERMKRLHVDKSGAHLPPSLWRGQRDLGILLNKTAKHLRKRPDTVRRQKVQDASPVGPNMRTYRLLIRYHAVTAGNVDRVTELLEEMSVFRMSAHGSVYFHVFRGFALHGGVRYSSWTRTRLERIYTAFLASVRDAQDKRNTGRDRPIEEEVEQEDVNHFQPSIAIIILQAYGKCSTRELTMEVWDEIRRRWEPGREEVEEVSGALAGIRWHED